MMSGLSSNPLTHQQINRQDNSRKKGGRKMTDNMLFLWDNMTELGIATDEELRLACALCGTTEETLKRVLYIRTGYRNIEQILEEEEE